MPHPIRSLPFTRITRQPVRWLWCGRIPIGKVSIVEGDGAAGKSTLMTWLAARVSTGTLDGDLNGEAAGVIIFSAEDDNADTIRPRLEAQGADLGNVRGIDDDSLTFPADLERLRAMIVRHEARLVIIDPISSYLGEGVSLHNDVSMRRAIGPLKDIAADAECAIVVLRHLNGRVLEPAYRRGLGGIALSNLARMRWLLGPHPADPGRRVLAYVKGNLDGRVTTSVEIVREEAGRVVIGEEIDCSADEMLAVDHCPGPQRTDPRQWLRTYLNGREVPTKIVEGAAAEVGISRRTLDRAREALGVLNRRERVGRTHRTLLRLPDGVADGGVAGTVENGD